MKSREEDSHEQDELEEKEAYVRPVQDSFPLRMSILGTCRKINLGGKTYEKMEKKNGGVEFGVGTDDGDDIDGQRPDDGGSA